MKKLSSLLERLCWRLRWWIVRLLVGKDICIMNAEIHGTSNLKGKGYIYGCMIWQEKER